MISTRQNLFFKEIIVDLEGCILCNESVESTCRLLIRCSFLGQVWYRVFRWLGWEFVSPPYLTSFLSIIFNICLLNCLWRIYLTQKSILSHVAFHPILFKKNVLTIMKISLLLLLVFSCGTSLDQEKMLLNRKRIELDYASLLNSTCLVNEFGL